MAADYSCSCDHYFHVEKEDCYLSCPYSLLLN